MNAAGRIATNIAHTILGITQPTKTAGQPLSLVPTASSDNDDAYLAILRAMARSEGKAYPNLAQYRSQGVMYSRSSWVYIAVQKIARSAALVELNAVRLDGDQKKRVPNHPIEDLFRHPNRWQSRFEFMEQTFGFKAINGNAYWFLSGPEGGVPAELLVLRPDRVRIVAGLNTDEPVAGYVYTVDGTEIPLDVNEVVHFKSFHPLSDYYGLSALEVLALTTQTDVAMKEWDRNFFGFNNGVPAGIVNVKKPITQIEFDMLKEQWLENYGGRQRKTAFLKADEVSYQDIGLSHIDMDFIAGMQFSKEEIMLAYGVPPGMLDKNATEANAQAGAEFFTAQTIWPIMQEFCQKITSDIVPFYGTDIMIEPEDIRVRNTKAEREELQARQPFLTINEVRQMYMKLSPVIWGDIPAAGAAAVAITGSQIGDDMSSSSAPRPQFIRRTPADLATGQKETTQENKQNAKENVKPAAKSEPVVKTKASEKEIARFVTFATKRVGTDRADEIDGFEFHDTPEPLVLAVKALADSKETLRLLAPAKRLSVSQRVSPDGTPDPQAAEKAKTVLSLQQVAASVLAEQRDGIIDLLGDEPADTLHARSVYKAFWQMQNDLTAMRFGPLAQKAVADAALDVAAVLEVRTGEAVRREFTKEAHAYTDEWLDEQLRQFNADTRAGVKRLLEVWGELTTSEDEALLSAVRESELFGLNRAAQFAEAEAARLFSVGAYFGSKALATKMAVKMLTDLHDVSEQAGAQVFVRPEIQYDADDRPVAVRLQWHSIKTSAGSMPVTPIRGQALPSSEAQRFDPIHPQEIDEAFTEFEQIMTRGNISA